MLPRKYTQALVSKLLKLKSTATLDVESGASIRVVSAQTGIATNTISSSELAVLDGITATATEINRAADTSARLVAAGSALTVTEALHDGKLILLDTAAGSTCTLPAASGSGARFRFMISTVATSNSHIIKVANSSDTMVGQILNISDDAGNTVKPFFASSTDDTITLNRSTTGSTRKAEVIELIDLAANLWAVNGVVAGTGTEATPFSATV